MWHNPQKQKPQRDGIISKEFVYVVFAIVVGVYYNQNRKDKNSTGEEIPTIKEEEFEKVPRENYTD